MITTKEDNKLLLAAETEWTLNNVNELREKVKAKIQGDGFDTIVVDFTRISYVDSAGIKLLIGLYKTCLSRNISLEITASSPDILETFRTCGLNKLVTINEGAS